MIMVTLTRNYIPTHYLLQTVVRYFSAVLNVYMQYEMMLNGLVFLNIYTEVKVQRRTNLSNK